MKVLITGGTGFVGSHLAEELIKRGDEVHCLVRQHSDLRWLKPLNVKYVYGELTDKDSLIETVKDKDIIYHVAGVISAKNRAGYEQGNYLATKNLIETVYQYNRRISRFIHISTLAAVGPCLDGVCHNETVSPCPISDYGQTKLKGENEVLKYSALLPVTIVRPPVVYGPRDTGLYTLFKVISRGIKPVFAENKYVSIIYISDLIEGIIRAATNLKGVGVTYFITNDEPVSFNYLGNLIANTMGKKTINIYLSDNLLKAAATISDMFTLLNPEISIFNRQKASEMTQKLWGCFNDRAKRELGFNQKVSTEDGFYRTVRWYEQMQWI